MVVKNSYIRGVQRWIAITYVSLHMEKITISNINIVFLPMVSGNIGYNSLIPNGR